MAIRRLLSATVLCGGLVVVLAGCASRALSVGNSVTDSPIAGTAITIPATNIVTGLGTVGPPGTVWPPTGTPYASPSSSTSTTDSLSISLTEADSGLTITVRLGARIDVALRPSRGSYDPPAVDKPGVLREDAHSGGYPANTPATAQFTAVAPGTARITSLTDMACLHLPLPCLPPQRMFIVTITVR